MPGSFEGHPENVGEYVPQTVGQAAQGVANIARGNIARGGRQIIAGAGNALMPTVPFVAAAAPVATAVTLGTGAAGQYGGQKVAEALGATPDQAGLTGDIAGLVTGYGAAKGAELASRLRSPLGDVAVKPRGAIPPENYTPTELKAYADQNGIPLNAAQATEHNLPRNLQSAGERATVGGTEVRQQIRASQNAVAQHAENLMQGVSPNTPDLATAGDAIQKNVGTALEREQLQSRQDYAAIDQQANGVTVDLKPLKQTAQRILGDSNFVRKVGSLDPKKAASILQDLGNLPDNGTFSQAQQLRSALLDASRTPELAISTQAQGWIKQLTGSVDSEMMNAARSKPGLEPQFRAANNRWTQLQEDFNNPRSPLFQAMQQPDPSKIPQLFTQLGQTGGSPYNAQLLDRYGIPKGPVKWAVLNDLANKDFRLWSKNLGGYSDDFLRTLFTPQELDHVYMTGAISRSVGLNTNPSGTAVVSGAMADVQSPMKSMLPKGIAARLTKSPGFNQRMMRPPVPVTPARVPLSVLLGTQTLRGQSPDEQ